MAILRNINVARKYKVNPATVGNWIEQAKSGRIDLELTSVRGRTYLEDTEHNHLELQRLKEQGVKFRAKNLDTPIKITPNPRIYDIFTDKQLISLVVSIKNDNLIPTKFSYADEGARYYYKAIQSELEIEGNETPLELKTLNYHLKNFIYNLVERGKKVNLVEIGPDYSTFLVGEVITFLQENNALNHYVSVGISEEMHNIRQKTLRNNHNVEIIKYNKDIEEQTLKDILFLEKDGSNDIVNICLYLNATISNVKNVNLLLNNFSESLVGEDRLVVNTYLVDHKRKNSISKNLNKNLRESREKWLVTDLGLDNYITFESQEYDLIKTTKRRFMSVQKDLDLEILINKQKYTLSLKRDQKLNIFFSKRWEMEDIIPLFNDAGLILEQYNLFEETKNATFFLKKRFS